MGYVIVEFPERREVFVDHASQGDNREATGEYRILRIGDGLQTFRLGGPQDYTPLSRTVDIVDTTPIEPLRVIFERNV